MKVLLYSHKNDIDGIGCLVLAKLAFKDLDYFLLPNVKELEELVRTHLETNYLTNYDQIFITDLALNEPALSLLADSSFKDKTQILDHHQYAINENLNRFPFTFIEEVKNGKKRCATEIFYEYLVNNNYLKPSESLNHFTELTRLEDTWDWKQDKNIGIKAHDLAILFNAIGIDKYINVCLEKLNQNSFNFTKEENQIIQNKKDEYNKNLKNILTETEYFIDKFGNKYGIVYADYEYRNELAEFIVKIGNPENIKYLIVTALDKGEYGQKSYRSIDSTCDVNKIASNYGGGGHLNAAAVNITKEQKEKALTLTRKEGLKYLAESKFD